ncbi:MAG: serine--tRNA ligase, partial [Bacteroidales bacterium]|nr:serine--tRNA ligase [Bacteroidales bacterium]
MLTVKYIKENKELVIEKLKIKGFVNSEIIENIILLDGKRRTIQVEQDNAQAKLNSISKEIGNLFKTGKTNEANAAKEQTIMLKEKIKRIGQQADEIENKLKILLIQVPNIPHQSVP